MIFLHAANQSISDELDIVIHGLASHPKDRVIALWRRQQ